MTPPVSERGTKVISARPLDPDAAQWQKIAADLEAGQLKRVQDMATAWGGVISALAGIFGVVLVVKGPQDITKLPYPWPVITGLVLLAALVALIVAIFRAAMAAEGSLKPFYFSGTTVRQELRQRTEVATSQLKTSRWFALVAVVCVAVSIAITWFATPAEQTVAPMALVLEKSGVVLCGALKTGEDGRVALQPPGSATPIALADVVSVTPVATCA